ncbi:aminoacyl-tRNA hydrolase [Hydrogenimonas urashimensis]|uniref:aminoacyl-tRNA hydrolase n=1 Tax=Hydrogenimonas urashimensis TaxID=2740515 RepID=UPI0019164303|nr:aminoacyl-tRNA hydrolase [Hydrogenimonas urashimensis]
MWLIVGLGNPGAKYEHTRHNIGFLTLDRLVGMTGAHPLSSSSFHGKLFKSGQTLFLKPETFMNRSGVAVQAVKQFFKIDLEQIVVIHDDLDLPFGAVRFKQGGGNGGHNGLKSIDAMVGQDYIRVRMGIGKPVYKSQVIDYVLSDFTPEQMRVLPLWIEHAAKATLELTRHPVDRVASLYSIRKPAWETP